MLETSSLLSIQASWSDFWQQGGGPCLVIGLGHDWRSGRLAGSGLARVGLEAGAWRRWTKSWSKGRIGPSRDMGLR
ncbi:unnamed protein product [Prunus armeniaca]